MINGRSTVKIQNLANDIESLANFFFSATNLLHLKKNSQRSSKIMSGQLRKPACDLQYATEFEALYESVYLNLMKTMI